MIERFFKLLVFVWMMSMLPVGCGVVFSHNPYGVAYFISLLVLMAIVYVLTGKNLMVILDDWMNG